MRCNILNVFTRQLDNKTSQMMNAEGNVFFRTREFFGTAAVVKYNEGQEQVIFEGAPGNPATLYRKRADQGGEPQEIKGNKILYNRKTGVFQLEGGKVITGRLEPEEPQRKGPLALGSQPDALLLLARLDADCQNEPFPALRLIARHDR